MNDTGQNRSYQQLPNTVLGYDIGTNQIVQQPVSVSTSYPGTQVVKVTGSVDRILIQPLPGQLIIIDALTTAKAVSVQSSKVDVAGVGPVAVVPAGSYGILISNQSGWYFIPSAPSTSGFPMVWFESLAAMAAAPGPTFTTLAWQAETDAPYEFIPGDTSTVNGWSVVGVTGGVAGRWLLRASSISITPLGNAADDWARLNLAMTALAYKAKIILRPGTWLAKTAGAVPSGTWIEMEPGVTIISTIVNVGFMSSVFAADAVPIDNGVLNGTPVLYGITFSLTGMVQKPTVNQWISIGHATSLSVYRVEAISAGGPPWTVTVDRPIVFPFVSGDDVSSFSSIPQDIRIDGHDTHLSGSGNQMIEFARGFNIRLSDMFMDGANGVPSGAAFGFDVGCRECVMDGLTANMEGTVNAPGMYFQSNERSIGRRLRSRNGDVGIIVYDSYSTGLEDAWAYNAVRGTLFASLDDGGNASLGNFDCWLQGGGSVRCGIGLNIWGSRNTTLQEFTSRGCTIAGIQVEVGTNSPGTADSFFSGCSSIDSLASVIINAGVKGTRFQGIVTSGSATAWSAADDVKVDDWIHAHGVAVTQVGTFNGSITKITRANVTGTGVIGSGTLLEFGGSRVDIRGSEFITNLANLALYLTNGVIFVDTTTIVADRGIDSNAAKTIRLGQGNNFSGCNTPLPPNGAKYVSRGTVTSNGATAVDVTWPNITADDAPIPYLVTRGATCVGGMPKVTIVPGVKFQLTGVASDGVDTVWGFRFAS